MQEGHVASRGGSECQVQKANAQGGMGLDFPLNPITGFRISHVLYLEKSRISKLFSDSFETEVNSRVIGGLGVSKGMPEIQDQTPAPVGGHG